MVIILTLLFPFLIGFIFLLRYLKSKDSKSLRRFSAVSAANLMLLISLYVLYSTGLSLFRLEQPHLIWISTGFIMILMLSLKVQVLIDIYRRSKDPKNYHYNYFGKKVLHGEVALRKDLGVFVITIPVFLFSGSYYVAKLINLILHGSF